MLSLKYYYSFDSVNIKQSLIGHESPNELVVPGHDIGRIGNLMEVC